jgi:hypothetical protein
VTAIRADAIPNPATLVRWALGLLLAFALAAPPAAAQEAPGPAQTAPRAPGEIEIVVDQFGVGGVARPGSMTGVELALTDNAPAPRRVAVRWHIPDADGDTMLAERRVTLNPGRATRVWLYARLPWSTTGSSVFAITVHALVDAGPGGSTVGRRLAATRVQPRRVAAAETDLIGVVGADSLGLRQYELRLSAAAGGRQPTAHEVIEIVSGLEPSRLPDSWLGLDALSVLVWEGGSPTDLGDVERPQAIREWIARGGHLIVVLEAVGGAWTAADNPLADLLPDAPVRRVSGQPLRPFASVLTDRAGEDRLPADATIHAFRIEPGTPPADATPLIVGPGDRPVVVRRLFGLGMVTVVGLDLRVDDWTRTSAFHADQFWHRVIGKRFEILTDDQLNEIDDGALRTAAPPIQIDRFIEPQIDRSTAAGVGVLLALIVFVAYWLIGGPIGYWLLGLRGWKRHSWVAFVGVTAVFSVIAWLGANRLRETELSATHLTFVDHVYGQPVQRAVTWASVLLPGYGDQRLSLGTGEGDEAWTPVLQPWSSPEGTGILLQFPDARTYPVDADRPAEAGVPARSTVKQLRLSWLGPRRWDTPVPVGPEHAPRLTGDPSAPVAGRLVHGLPGPLEEITIVVQEGAAGRSPRDGAPERRLVSNAGFRLVSITDPWEPGEELDLGVVGELRLAEMMGEQNLGAKPLKAFGAIQQGTVGYDRNRARKDYERLGWYSAIQPPAFRDVDVLRASPMLRRSDGHELDLSRWLTQPVLVVTGHLRGPTAGEDIPAPLRSGPEGEERPVPMDGWTVVRWVYPLPPAPEVARPRGARD